MTIRTAVVAVTVLLTASTVRAEVCPDNIPEDSTTRRAQAKKWFSIGESAAGAGEDVAALKAYQCSLRFVSHGFTAYNIAQVAERVGDLELAIASYNQYLLLVPEAKDAQEVNERLESLKDRLAKARQREKAMAAMAAATAKGPAKGIEPPAGEVAGAGAPDQGSTPVGGSTTDARDSKPTESVTEATPHSGSKYRTAAWIVYGGAGVAGGGSGHECPCSRQDGHLQLEVQRHPPGLVGGPIRVQRRQASGLHVLRAPGPGRSRGGGWYGPRVASYRVQRGGSETSARRRPGARLGRKVLAEDTSSPASSGLFLCRRG
jgi:hypothetical protein